MSIATERLYSRAGRIALRFREFERCREVRLQASATIDESLLPRLVESLGADTVALDTVTRELYGQDISGDEQPVLAVVRPARTEDVVRTVDFAREHDLVIAPRGGGMSYSSGYVCPGGRTLCLDMARMDEVVEVNAQDMYVTVQAGCTWRTLNESLAPLGLRTPFRGTLSGLRATVGGGLSQNSLFWGSARHGTAADSVIGFEIVLANGERLRTGAGAQIRSNPFFRHYGPDLTGLFTCDAGALGIKTEATLRLLPTGEGRASASFDFPSHAPLMRAMSEVARQRLADACFAFDPVMRAQRMKRESLLADAKALGGVVSGQGSVLGGLREGVKVAVAGRGFMKDVDYSVHFMVEEATRAAADESVERIRAVCAAGGGREIENSIPKIAQANPFGPLNSMIGPAGERWLPVHGLFPHSRAIAAYEAVEALFEENRREMERHNILHGTLLTYADTHCFVVEPVFYWPDRLNALHRHSVEPAVLRKVNRFPEDLEARGEVMRMRDELIALFRDLGAVHLQIGRRYPYPEGLADTPRRLVSALKRLLDPDGLINPGALGLPAD